VIPIGTIVKCKDIDGLYQVDWIGGFGERQYASVRCLTNKFPSGCRNLYLSRLSVATDEDIVKSLCEISTTFELGGGVSAQIVEDGMYLVGKLGDVNFLYLPEVLKLRDMLLKEL